MYVSIWMLLIVISLASSFAAFIWGLHSGQFTNQERARYLPLADGLPPIPAEGLSRRRPEGYGLMAVLVLGLVVLIAPVVILLCRL